ncbi:MAG: helicase C-terminal domain-containing protein [bacterium]|nr:helicase C-terminal domain-containing protein [bacterium]
MDILNIWSNLAKSLPDFEQRSDQITMSNAIGEILLTKEHLICEAGTGIGKSFAYLLPIINFIKNSNPSQNKTGEQHSRLVVSTYTKTLQQQLMEKDIPLLQSAGLEFKASLALGSANYLCLRRKDKLVIEKMQLLFPGEKSKETDRLILWSAKTETGLRSEFEKEGVSDIFNEFSRDPDLCIGQKCSYFNRCFYKKARENLKKADVILVNHWLFFADVASGRKILPEYDALVFDEAHELEDVATSFAGIDISNYSIDYFLRIIKREIGKVPEFTEIVRSVSGASTDFFNMIKNIAGKNKTFRVIDKIGSEFPTEFDTIRKALKEIRKRTDDPERMVELEKYITKCSNIRATLNSFLEQKEPDTVHWIESSQYRDARKPRIAIRSAPISVASWMQKNVFSHDIPIVLTSATLTVDKKFDFVADRIGMTTRKELLLASSFDYKDNVILYIPAKGILPKDLKYPEFIAKQVETLVKTTSQTGGTLVLFTSFKLMNGVYSMLNGKLSVPCLKQDEFGKNELLRRFKEKPSVLFGVSSFWQGIDIPGKALSTVIITKLPFEVPDSPITESRAEKITEDGGIPFIEYQLPQAVMQLKQGFGRLIRRKEDFGIVAILDMRIVNKEYGRTFIASLPMHKRVRDIKPVEKFFKDKKAVLK